MPDILLHDCVMPKDGEELNIVIHSDGRVDWVKRNPFEYIPTETKAIPLPPHGELRDFDYTKALCLPPDDKMRTFIEMTCESMMMTAPVIAEPDSDKEAIQKEWDRYTEERRKEFDDIIHGRVKINSDLQEYV